MLSLVIQFVTTSFLEQNYGATHKLHNTTMGRTRVLPSVTSGHKVNDIEELQIKESGSENTHNCVNN